MAKSTINDINLDEWKSYNDIFTDSLWIIDKRDNSKSHKGDYHGNFIPQIPNQLIQRYTKKNDWIIDCFLGSGTSIIEAKSLQRNSIGIEIDDKILELAKERIDIIESPSKVILINDDSSTVNLDLYLDSIGVKNVQFILFHPPYWDIIKFNDHTANLSNSKTLSDFLDRFFGVVDNICKHLEKNRYFAVVIGDVYKDSELIPLSSYVTTMMIDRGYKLKSIVVKNINETKAKQNQKSIWRYRALAGGFYVFRHEYVLIFQNAKSKNRI